MSDSRTLQPGQSVSAGRFTLVRALGRGGMGVVWLGQDTRLGEEVALKFLPPEVAADAVALNDLRRETARSHKLTHPNIIRIHDFHEQSDAAFISMEFVDGPTLSAYRLQQANQVLTWEQLAPLVQQLCAALDYAHGESVIHRDLKPANVMLDAKGRLKLADFGIAAVVSDSVSRISMLGTSGTLAYMSPQQLTGERPAATDDIYALGATLYELLTGKPPFYSGDITHQVLQKSPEPLEERLVALGIQNAIPGDVAALIMACLAKDPAQRPQSAAAVAGWIGLEARPNRWTESLVGDSSHEVSPSPPDESEPAIAAGLRFRASWIAAGAAGCLILGIVSWLFIAGLHKRANRGTASSPVQAGAPNAAPPLGSDVVTLFDGTSTAAWKGSKRETFPSASWSVEKDVLKTITLGPFGPAKENLVTRASFQNFELEFEWKLDPGGNSGVFYGGREFQLCDDERHPNGKVPESSCGSLCNILAPNSSKPPVPAGQFHQGKLVVNGSQVEHWLNGRKILEYDLASETFKAQVQTAKSKTAYLGSVAEICQGGEMPIILQNHTGTASFRNIRLRKLSAAAPTAANEGFESLFDGRDLSGWEGDPAVWSVKDGVINARATSPKSSLLIRENLAVSNFELRLSCRLVGDNAVSAIAGNIGVRCRCHPDATPAVTGYQMDFGVNAQANREIFAGPPRGILAKTGEKVLAQSGGEKGTVRVIGSVNTPDEIEAVFKSNDWNELTIIAQDNHLIYKINGLVAAELTDDDEAHRSMSGQLALKLWFNKGPVVAAQIKNIRFKPLK